MQKVSIIIPVFNERNTILRILKKIEEAKLPPGWQKEIIIVDNHSTDGTREMLQQLHGLYTILFHEKNLGKGGALKTGFRNAKGNYLLIQDADLEYHPEEYFDLLSALDPKKTPIIFGSRNLRKENKPLNLVYFYGGVLLSKIFNLLFGTKLTDISTCYKLFPRILISDLLKSPVNDFIFDAVDLNVIMLRHRLPIREIPISYTPRTRKEGKKIYWWHGFKVLLRMLYFKFMKI